MSKHTPGPWTTKPGTFWICTVGNNFDDPGVWSAYPVKDGEKYPFGDKAADARLISAAPEMLEALQYYAQTFCEHGLDNYEGCGKLSDDDCSGCRARAAIKKATGQ
jgi:hypothetical protein